MVDPFADDPSGVVEVDGSVLHDGVRDMALVANPGIVLRVSEPVVGNRRRDSALVDLLGPSTPPGRLIFLIGVKSFVGGHRGGSATDA